MEVPTPNQPRKPLELFDLPLEIIQAIPTHIGRPRHLAALTRTCKAWYEIAGKQLYSIDGYYVTKWALSMRRPETIYRAIAYNEAIFSPRHLSDAVKMGDVGVVKTMLERPNMRQSVNMSGGGPPLLWAIRTGSAAMARLLLENGADRLIDGEGEPTIYLTTCVMENQPGVFQELLRYGARGLRVLPAVINSNNVSFDMLFMILDQVRGCDAQELCTGLYSAARLGKTLIVDILVEVGADVNLAVHESRTALYYAALYGHFATFLRLIDHGAIVRTEKTGETLLHAARSADIAEWLLRHGLPVDAPSGAPQTALSMACEAGCRAVVDVLWEAGADINGIPTWTEEEPPEIARQVHCFPTPLHVAVHMQRLSLVTYLLERGADPLITRGPSRRFNRHRRMYIRPADLPTWGLLLHEPTRPLDDALKSPCDYMNLMLQNGVDVNAKRPDGKTIVHVAATSKSYPVTRLYEIGADINARDNAGETMLHIAARTGGGGVAIRLASKLGVDMDAMNNKGQTPLMLSCYSRDADTMRTLIGSGANVHLVVGNQARGEDAFLMVLKRKSSLNLMRELIAQGIDPKKYRRFKLSPSVRNRLHTLIEFPELVRSSTERG